MASASLVSGTYPDAPSNRPNRAWAWLPLLLVALVRVSWIRAIPPDPVGPVDAEGFHLLAANLLDGTGFAIGWTPPFCPTAIRTPLYPLLLAGSYTLLGRDPARVVYAQVLLEVLTAAWVVRLARRVTTLRSGAAAAYGWGLAAGALYALNGTTQRFTGALLSETLLLSLVAAALDLTSRTLVAPTWRRALPAGLVWGLAVLTKPNVQYLALATGCLVLARGWGLCPDRRRGGAAARGAIVAFSGALVVVILPWVVRNRLVIGRWMISTVFEENLARVSAVATLAELEGVRAEPWTETWEHLYRRVVGCTGAGAALSESCPPLWVRADCPQLYRWQARATASARRLVVGHLGAYIRAHLGGVARAALDPGHRFWYSTITGRDWSETGVVALIGERMVWSLQRGAVGDALQAFWTQRVREIPAVAAAIWWGLAAARLALWALAVRGAWRLRGQPNVSLLLAGVTAYHLLLPGPISHDRLYAPAIPAVCVLLVWGCARSPWRGATSGPSSLSERDLR